MESSNYESAIDLFERARAQVQHCQNRLPLVVSLVIPLISLVQRIEITYFRF